MTYQPSLRDLLNARVAELWKEWALEHSLDPQRSHVPIPRDARTENDYIDFIAHLQIHTDPPEWTPELAEKLTEIFFSAPYRKEGNEPSSHTGLEAVFGYLVANYWPRNLHI